MKQFKISILIFLVLSFVFGILYPLSMTGIGQILFPKKANGSVVFLNGRIIGSELVGQSFKSPWYFHGRPSVVNYDASNSGASNFGPTNKKFIDQVREAAERVKRENGLPADAKLPPDMVLASASGLDPDISLESALVQVNRIARVRGIDRPLVIEILNKTREKQYFNLFGNSFVNVLKLNLALDDLQKRK
ncbi:MAG: potassium-transporting ATPase subunit C [Spirochaetes bacterium RBG_16_49_21]|nr:MAG: potassium-transporting ATPase subunit C [Spirochaetes bacterium RBG_16_49_21]